MTRPGWAGLAKARIRSPAGAGTFGLHGRARTAGLYRRRRKPPVAVDRYQRKGGPRASGYWQPAVLSQDERQMFGKPATQLPAPSQKLVTYSEMSSTVEQPLAQIVEVP